MNERLQENCFNHLQREAVARCPECRRFFCRECITEHEERVVCASCLKAVTAGSGSRRIRWPALAAPFQLATGLLIAWLLFYGLGQVLTAIPADFHAGGWKQLSQEMVE